MRVENLNIDELQIIYNYREEFGVEDLVPSIERDGIIQPIHLDQNKNVIGGHRRLQAAKEIKLKTVPCIIRKVKDVTHLKYLGAIENLKRQSYKPSEKAKAISDCKKYEKQQGEVTSRQSTGRGRKKDEEKNTFAEKLSKETGIAASTINRKARMGEKMSHLLASSLDAGTITEKQAEQLIRLVKSEQDKVIILVKGKSLVNTKAIVESKLSNIEPQVKIEGLPIDIWGQRFYKDLERLKEKIQTGNEKKVWNHLPGYVAKLRGHFDFCTYAERDFDCIPLPRGFLDKSS